MYSNQMTIEEANSKSLNDITLSATDEIYMSADTWGEEYIGKMDEWEKVIPEAEADARMTGWYDWFSGDDKYDSWDDYRSYLISQLIEVEVVEE